MKPHTASTLTNAIAGYIHGIHPAETKYPAAPAKMRRAVKVKKKRDAIALNKPLEEVVKRLMRIGVPETPDAKRFIGGNLPEELC